MAALSANIAQDVPTPNSCRLLIVNDRLEPGLFAPETIASLHRALAEGILDSRSEQDLENLIDLIKDRNIDSRRVLLSGFADPVGGAAYNVALSKDRADAVATRLRLAGIPVPTRNVMGIGEDSPIAHNDGDRDELGARKNRRVEVWIES